VSGPARPIVALVRDLLFQTRIAETARRLGYPCRTVRSVDELRAGLAEAPGLVMLDLTATAVDLDAALGAVEAAGRPAPVLGWTTHVLWKQTKPLHGRCDRVVTREELTEKLPDLLRDCLEPPAHPPSPPPPPTGGEGGAGARGPRVPQPESGAQG